MWLHESLNKWIIVEQEQLKTVLNLLDHIHLFQYYLSDILNT